MEPNKEDSDKHVENDEQVKELTKADTQYINCRICTKYDEAFFPINSEENGQTLGDMLLAIASIEIPFSDMIPFQMCMECRNNVIFCFEFKIKCQNSFYALQEELQQTIIEIGQGNPNSMSKMTEWNVAVKKETQEIESYIMNVKEEMPDVNNVAEYLDDNIFEDECSKQNSKEERSPSKVKEKVKAINIVKGSGFKVFHPCKICNKKFVSALNLRAHMKIHNSDEKNLISCKNCKEKFTSEHDLTVHSALHTKGDKWKCFECSKEFYDRTCFRRHIRRHYNTKEFACEWCSKQFAELCGLRRHERVHTGETRENRYNCTQCDKRYPNKYQLNMHLMRHTGLRPCTCDICGKSFPSTRLLNSHKLTHTDDKPYACPVCDKRFRHESTRKSHVLTHTGEKPIVCSVCGKTFRQNSNFTVHMRSHTGERPYACSQCTRNFTSTSALNTHMTSHSKEKPFACPVCGKRFLRQSLTNHMRLHTGEKAHACPACPRRFLTASRLKDHSKIHTDEKPFECKTCSARFKKQITLTNHEKKHAAYKVTKEKPGRKGNAKAMIKREVIDYKETSEDNSDINLQITEVPIDVSEELVLEDDSNGKTELIVIEEKLVSPQLLDGITLKVYHIDQSLVQTQE